jgi:hypothetical protein
MNCDVSCQKLSNKVVFILIECIVIVSSNWYVHMTQNKYERKVLLVDGSALYNSLDL